MANQAPVKYFHSANFATKLRVPEGMPYVEESTIDEIEEALQQGLAVHGGGCDGYVFVWPTDHGFEGDLYFMGLPRPYHFDSAREAADFASELCD